MNNNKQQLYIILLKELVDELTGVDPKAKESLYSNQENTKSQIESLSSASAQPSQAAEGGLNTDEGGQKTQTPQKEGQDYAIKEDQVTSIVKTWLFFANSIMSGEFLAYPFYSETLDSIIITIRDTYNKILNASVDGDIVNAPQDLPPVLVAIHDLCFELRSRCILMRSQIDLEEKKQIWDTFTPLPLQWINDSNKDEENKLLISWLQQLVMGLIEMTEIDFTCHTSKEKLKSLHLLFDACQQTKNITVSRGKRPCTPFIEDPDPRSFPTEIPYGIHLLHTIQCKCSLLAYQSIFITKQEGRSNVFNSSTPNTRAWNKDKHESVPYKAVESSLFIVDGDRKETLDLDKNPLFSFWKEHLYYHKQIKAPVDNNEHIKKYNEYINTSKNNRERISEAITKIQALGFSPNIQELNTIILQTTSREDNDPPFEFLLACMRTIKGLEIDRNNYQDSHTRVKLLGDLLLLLHELKTRCECINQSYEQTRLFEESFFTYDLHPIPFFVASLGSKYISTDWLDKQGNYYNWLLRQYRIQESEALKNLNQTLTTELDAKQKELDIKQGELGIKQEELDAKQKELDTKQEELDTKQEKYESDLREQQRDYLTLLGIFAAIITLSVGLVTSFKLAESIWDYMAMLGGAYVLIGLLVIVLYLRNTTKKEEGQLTIATMNKSMVIAACLGVLGVGMKGYKEIFSQDTKHESQPTAVSPTTVNQVHIGIPKDGASIDPSQGKTPKRQIDTVAK